MSTTSHPLRFDPCVSLDLEEKDLEDIVSKAKDWALMHGACMRLRQQYNSDSIHFAPFVLFPSTFPTKEFLKAIELQPLVNELVHKIACNYEFLKNALAVTVTVDSFTSALFKIYSDVHDEGISQDVCCGLFRSDYMLHKDTVRQVEINTIASSFAGISTRIPLLHRFVLQELSRSEKLNQLPENRALELLCNGLLKAWEIYSETSAVILFVVEDITYNICDQRFHEFEIRRQNPSVKVLRLTLTQLGRGRAVLGLNKQLIVDGHEVAVVYFRSGYAPEQYPSSDGCEWDARLTIERSRAIKCPSVAYHLAGTKKVQQVLAQPGVLEELLGDMTKVNKLRACFTGLYTLDLNAEGDRAVSMALKNPENFVLKPQREGGGNNIYGREVAEVLEKLKDDPERASYILMDVIQPPLLQNWIIRPGNKPMLADTISELGIFGIVIGNSKEIVHNSVGGHMLRTKLNTANEGGVAAGLGALDSPYLVDM